ncbi:MAG: hypothetical protein HY698_21535 [Deltaproteobacteria bacterium]|nr:hypothetical protein [Deltaproteobacteria bacterium]
MIARMWNGLASVAVVLAAACSQGTRAEDVPGPLKDLDHSIAGVAVELRDQEISGEYRLALKTHPGAAAIARSLEEGGCRVELAEARLFEPLNEPGPVAAFAPATCTADRRALVTAVFLPNLGGVMRVTAQLVEMEQGEAVRMRTWRAQPEGVVEGIVDLRDPDVTEGERDVGVQEQAVGLPGMGGSPCREGRTCCTCLSYARDAVGLVADMGCSWVTYLGCAALGLSGGIPGLACGYVVWTMCDYGESYVRRKGARFACEAIGLCD